MWISDLKLNENGIRLSTKYKGISVTEYRFIKQFSNDVEAYSLSMIYVGAIKQFSNDVEAYSLSKIYGRARV
jgi:hypothetical protein